MARKAKDVTPDPTHNMSAMDLEMKRCDALNHGIVLEKEMDAAKAVVKSISAKIGVNKKDYEKYGGVKVDYDWYLQTRKREPEDVDAETRRRTNVARSMNLPIGASLGRMENGESVASAVDKAAVFDFEDNSGYQAAFDGKSPDDNPFEDGSPEFLKWHADFERGQIEAAKKAFGPKDTEAAD